MASKEGTRSLSTKYYGLVDTRDCLCAVVSVRTPLACEVGVISIPFPTPYPRHRGIAEVSLREMPDRVCTEVCTGVERSRACSTSWNLDFDASGR